MSTLAVSWITNNHVPDAIGCIVIELLLGSAALFLTMINSIALVGRSIQAEKLQGINKLVESDVMIRALYDVKGTDIGKNFVGYKVEMDFDRTKLTRLYLDRMTGVIYLKKYWIYGENIVDLLGGQIDRIQLKIKSQFPEVHHVDLEIV